MTSSNRAFIRAFSQPAGIAPQLAATAPRVDTATVQSHGTVVQDHGAVTSPPEETGKDSPMPRPHVQFPPTIRLDVGDRRHTRVAGVTDQPDEDSPLAQHRPLSDFALAPDVKDDFRPGLEVDRFAWPDVCGQIISRSETAIDRLVEQMILAAERGRSVVAVVGEDAGAGCTTTTLCLARRFSDWGASVALVDASFADPALAARLGLATTSGWEDVLRGDLPLAEVVIASHQENAVLLPLRHAVDPATVPELLGGVQAAVGVGVLRANYHVTLLDVAPLQSAEPSDSLAVHLAARVGVDGVVTVCSKSRGTCASDLPIVDQLTAAGVPIVGEIQNFVPLP